tara:strand:+ start:812 stop:1009 length:198 start_codon:yes stop_codon:yes gene_type:complete
MLKKMNIKIETIITVVAVVVGVGVAYGSLTTRVTDLENKVVDMNQMAIDIAVIKEKIENIDSKID